MVVDLIQWNPIVFLYLVFVVMCICILTWALWDCPPKGRTEWLNVAIGVLVVPVVLMIVGLVVGLLVAGGQYR